MCVLHCWVQVNTLRYDNLCSSDKEKPPYAPQTPAAITSPKLAVNEVTFLRALSEDHSEDDFAEADPVRDDLYFRRLRQSLRQASSCPRFDHFLPRYWTPEEETRVHAIYLGSRRRPWYHKMQQLRSVDSFYSSLEPFGSVVARLSKSTRLLTLNVQFFLTFICG